MADPAAIAADVAPAGAVPAVPARAAARIADGGPFLLFGATLVLAPLPLGSNRPWAWYLLAALVFACIAWWSIAAARSRAAPLAAHARPVLWWWAAWAAYPLVQVLPLPGALLEWLSPAAYNVHAYGRGVTEIAWGTLSVDAAATLSVFARYAAYAGILFLALVLLRERRRVRFMLGLLLVVGAAEAALGLFARFLELDLLAWDPTAAGTDTITVRGTFVNRNHFAALLVMCGAAGLGLIMSRLSAPREYPGLRARLAAAVERLLDWSSQRLVLVALIFAGLFFSASRGASLGLFTAFVVTSALAVLMRGRQTPEVRFAPFVFAAVVIAVLWMGAAPLAERALGTDLRADERLVQWELSLPLVRDYPAFGVGAGNYGEVFSLYRDGTLRPLTYDRAHSDWLEHLIDHGVVGTALLLGALLATYRVILAAFRKRRDLLARGALFAALLGTLAMIVHGAVDFVFQIPATAAYFFLLLGIGVVAAGLPHEDSRASARHSAPAGQDVSRERAEPKYGWRGGAAPARDVSLDDL